MSYRQDSYRGNSKWVGIVVLLAMLGYCASRAGNSPMSRLSTPESAERELLADREGGKLFATIKQTFPDEFDNLKRIVVKKAGDGASTEQIAETLADTVNTAELRHRLFVAQAPHDAFAVYRRAEIDLVAALAAQDVPNCARYTMDGKTGPLNNGDLQEKVLAMRLALWATAAAGRDHPANRSFTAPARADLQSIASGMIGQGLTHEEADRLLTPQGLASGDAQFKCKAGLAYDRALNDLEAVKADNIYGYLITRQS
jgi:hypothetical protein